ncbi:M1 family peptidase, partial [Streptomyces sp. NPDC059466]
TWVYEQAAPTSSYLVGLSIGKYQTVLLGDPGRKLMFDDRLYERGGLTLHALRCAMGDTAFFRMLRGWAGLHRGGAVSTAAFVAHVSRYAAEPLDDLFGAWLHTAKLPPLPVLTAPLPARPSYPPTNADSA